MKKYYAEKFAHRLPYGYSLAEGGLRIVVVCGSWGVSYQTGLLGQYSPRGMLLPIKVEVVWTYL